MAYVNSADESSQTGDAVAFRKPVLPSLKLSKFHFRYGSWVAAPPPMFMPPMRVRLTLNCTSADAVIFGCWYSTSALGFESCFCRSAEVLSAESTLVSGATGGGAALSRCQPTAIGVQRGGASCPSMRGRVLGSERRPQTGLRDYYLAAQLKWSRKNAVNAASADSVTA